MTMEKRAFFFKLHNELAERFGIEPGRYEREYAIFSILQNIEKGEDEKKTFLETFKVVYDVEVSEIMYKSCYANVEGFLGR